MSWERSRILHEEALKYLPSGVTYGNRYIDPYPVYLERAEGQFVWDVDGNRFVDLWMGHGALIMGHSYKPVIEEAVEQLKYGAHFGYSHEWEVRWAKQVCEMVPSAKMVRPTNSGTEANMYAVRLARAYTKKSLVGKFEGGWHGGYDALQVGVTYPVDKPSTLGLSENTVRDTVLLPYNNLEETERRVKGKDLACIVVEPVMGAGGFIPAEREFLKGLRKLCDEEGIILIFDEVITGFRLSPGGAQQLYGVIPDLTVLGKAVGGGPFPAGAFCGREDIMEMIDLRKHPNPYERVFHGGTYSGNPLTMRAGYTLLKELAKGDVHQYINSLGEYARSRLREVTSGVDIHITGVGSLVCLHFTKEKPYDIHTANRTKNLDMAKRYFRHVFGRGLLYVPPAVPHLFISAAHTRETVDQLIDSTEEFIRTKIL
ncbi:MAG: aspartate aminotransferase family protein [Nitrososphaerota archaeon]